MLCVRCGAKNYSGDGVCNKCGAALPRIPGGLSLPTLKRGHLDMLERACNDIKEQVISPDEFISILSSIHAKVEESLLSLKNIVPISLKDVEAENLLREEQKTASEGMEMMLAAIVEISAFCEHSEPDNPHFQEADHAPELHIESGLSMAKNATDLLNRSIELGDEVKSRLDLPLEEQNVG